MAPKAKAVPKGTRKVAKPAGVVFDGVTVQLNDHVFVSPPWTSREGEPYQVGRIMEFLPSTALPSNDSNNYPEGSVTGPRARVAFYLRPRDISNRYIADLRLVVATMNADVVPVSYIRGLCTVKHRDEIENLERYKREKDCFYFHSLYDRYLHRYFDAVPTNQVQNAPANIVAHLNNNFEYIICEPSMSLELCDAQRGCLVCHKWAASAESVNCALCKHVFHLSCLDPPLTQKPKTGYSWSCAPCSKAHEDEVEEYTESGTAITKKIAGDALKKSKGKGSDGKGAGNGALDKGKGKEVSPADSVTGLRLTNQWPMRYFGMHTEAYSVLDPHDSLYPRASTRLGNKFQAVVLPWDTDKKEEGAGDPVKPYFARRGRPPANPSVRAEKERKKRSEIVERGEDEATQTIYQPTKDVPDKALDTLLAEIRKLPTYAIAGVDLIDRTLALVRDGDTAAALTAAGKLKQTDLGHAIWSKEDQSKLVQGAAHHGNDIEDIADEIESKSIADIVKRYYMVLGHDMQEDIQREVETPVVPVISRSGRRASNISRVNYAEDWFENDESSEDEGSIVGPPVSAVEKKARICQVCQGKNSTTWYHCPESFGETSKAGKDHLMCDSCGTRWRHYGAQYPPGAEELKSLPALKKKAVERIEVKEKEKGKESEPQKEKPVKKEKEKEIVPIKAPVIIVAPPPPPPKPKLKPVLPSKPCVLCKRTDPKGSLVQCTNCTLSVHAACYGLSEKTSSLDWLCDLCDLEAKRTPVHAHPTCILCPPKVSGDAEPMTALDCVKLTEGKNYIHLLCGVFHPEIKFSDPSTFTVAEGLHLIPSKRREAECWVCKVKDVGACIKCEDCVRHFHISCAWSAGYKFSFEIQPLKKKRAKEALTMKFKEEEGAMSPCVWCPDHRFSPVERMTYDIGIKDPRSKLTALQTYVQANKGFKALDIFPILRKGRRLDTLLQPVLSPVQESGPIAEEESELIITDLKAASAIRSSNIPKVERIPKAPKAKIQKVKEATKKVKRVQEPIMPEVPEPAKQRGRKAGKGKGKLDAGLIKKKVVRYSAPPRALESTSTTPISTSSNFDSSSLAGQDGDASASSASSLFQFGLPPLPDPILSFVDSLPPLPELASMLPDLPEIDLLALAGLLPPPSIDDVLNALDMAIPAPDPMTPEEEELLVTQILERQIMISKNQTSPPDDSSSSSSSRGESSSSKRISLDQTTGDSKPVFKKLKLTHKGSASVGSTGGEYQRTPPMHDLPSESNGLVSTNGIVHTNFESEPVGVSTSLTNGNGSGDIKLGATNGTTEVRNAEGQFDFALDPSLMLEGPKSRNTVVQVE